MARTGPPTAHNLPGPSYWAALGILLLVAGVLAFVPLFNLLGYEFCAALSLVVSMTAGPVAIGAVRRMQATEARDERAGRAVLRPAAIGWLYNLSTLVPPLAIILLNALRVPNCNPLEGLLFFLLLPVATALIASCWGTAVGLAVRRRWLAGAVYALVWLGVAAANLAEFWTGLQMDSYNQLAGWIAGPVFEAVIRPGAPLVFSRLAGSCAAGLLLATVALFFDPASGRLRPASPISNHRLLGLVGILAIATAGLYLSSDRLGFGRSRAAVERILSATTVTDHFVIHHDPALPAGESALLARDHEFRYHQIERDLGPQDLPPIHSYVFPDPALKRRMVGAGRIQFAKPWQYTMALNHAGFPHPVLKHELVHVMAAGFGSWPTRTSARWGLWQNVGLIEGLAVAVDWPARTYDPHTWSAAQRKLGKAPAIRSLFDPIGFWAQAANRSYTLSGSFVRRLLDVHGFEPFRRAYRQGTLEGAYPVPVDTLIRNHRRFLDSLHLPGGLLDAARLRYERPSVFRRICAHEIAALRAEAGRQLASGRTTRAAEALQQIRSHLPGDPAALVQTARLRMQQDRPEEAVRILEELLRREDLGRARKARIGDRLGDVLVHLDRKAEARVLFGKLLAAHLGDASDRMAVCKLEALTQGAPGKRVLEFLRKGEADAAALLDLREAAAAAPGWGTVWYLLGRQLFNRGRYERAAPYLARAARAGLTWPALAAENLRLLAVCRHQCGQSARAAALLAVLARFPRHQGELQEARDWLDRIGFEQGRTAATAGE